MTRTKGGRERKEGSEKSGGERREYTRRGTHLIERVKIHKNGMQT